MNWFPVVTHQVAVDEDASLTAHSVQLLNLFQRAVVTHQVAVAENASLTALSMHGHNASDSPAARQTQSRQLKNLFSHIHQGWLQCFSGCSRQRGCVHATN